MRKICAKLVPKNLSVEQKANRLEICQDLLGRLEIEPNFLDQVITGDESWVCSARLTILKIVQSTRLVNMML